MTAKKKAAPKKDSEAHVDAEAPKRERNAQVIDRGRTTGQRVDAAMEHLKTHDAENPWSNYNAGGVCGVCGEQLR